MLSYIIIIPYNTFHSYFWFLICDDVDCGSLVHGMVSQQVLETKYQINAKLEF